MNIKLEDTTLYPLSDKDLKDQNQKVRGSEKSDTTIIALAPENGFSEQEDELLKNLISAIKRSPEQVPVYAFKEGEESSFSKIRREVSSKYFIIFGLEPKWLSLNLEVDLNNSIEFNDCKLIFTASPAALVADPSAKGPLWNALQRMFDLK